MSEEKKPIKKEKNDKKEAAGAVEKQSKRPPEKLMEAVVRIYGYDIPSAKSLYVGLTKIKGIGWSISNAICLKIGIPKSKKIGDLTKDEIAKVEAFLDNTEIYDFLKNRRSDPETGKTEHLYGTDLDVRREFDIKNMKKIKSYKGIRHSLKLPVRGQRTKSHFRAKKTTGGGIKKKPKAE
jgi:small subunit ribosomal protein S13